MPSILHPAINMKFFQVPVIFYTPKPNPSYYHFMQEHGHFLPLLKTNTYHYS
jgi:hypothetical protein